MAPPPTLALFCRQPVAEPYAQLLHAPHASGSGREFRTQEPGVGGLAGQPPDRGQTLVYRGWVKVKLLQLHPISRHHDPVQRESEFGAIPVDEVLDREFVGTP